MYNNIDEITAFLFDRAYSTELTEAQEDEILDLVDNQIEEYGWADTFKSWTSFLFQKCKTPESVINYANLFWWYGGQDHPIPNSHTFLAYFYYRIDFETEKYDKMSLWDSLATTILPKAGFQEAD